MTYHIQPCEGCRKGIATRYSDKHHRIAGTGAIHNDCRVNCHLCGEDAEDGRKVVYYLKRVVHDACKQEALAAMRAKAKVTVLKDDATRFVDRMGGGGFYTRKPRLSDPED